jgi:hypothetical protein
VIIDVKSTDSPNPMEVELALIVTDEAKTGVDVKAETKTAITIPTTHKRLDIPFTLDIQITLMYQITTLLKPNSWFPRI